MYDAGSLGFLGLLAGNFLGFRRSERRPTAMRRLWAEDDLAKRRETVFLLFWIVKPNLEGVLVF